MLGKRTARKRRGREYWRRVIAAQAAGGQTAVAYCAARGLGVSNFFKWKRLLRRATPRPSAGSWGGFARVVVKGGRRENTGLAAGAADRRLEIETPGGWVIRVWGEGNEAGLRQAVAALGGKGCC